MNKNLSNFAEIRKLDVSGSDNETEAVDTQGFDGVMIMFRAASASLVSHAMHSPTVTGDKLHASDREDIAGSEIPAAAVTLHDTIWFDFYRPAERYVAVDFNNDAHIDNDSVFVIKYHNRTRPIENDVEGEARGKLLVSTESGTK